MYDITIDLETTCNGGVDGKNPEAQYPNNKVLLYGWTNGIFIYTDHRGDGLYDMIETAHDRGDVVRIIGHNLKFDLKYLIRERPDLPWHKFEYYCTMYSEYRQSGQQYRFSSLVDSCARHGIAFTKGLDLGAILASGLKMEDIPLCDLKPYLVDDVQATNQLFNKQVNHAGYVEYMHQHVLPLAHMELLGLRIDKTKTAIAMSGLVSKEKVYDRELFAWAEARLEWDDGRPLDEGDIKYTAPRCVSYLLTGFPTAGFKKGTKHVIKFKPGCAPLLNPKQIAALWPSAKPTNLGFPMAKGVLDKMPKGSKASIYVTDLLDYRAAVKLSSTYFGPFLEEAALQDTIHPKMNMCQTVTGRLSSSKPNGQNMPPEARQVFVSEFGKLMEIDFKQLEVVALAHLSKDPQLLADIQNGEDIHFNTGRRVMGWKVPSDMTKKQRTIVKNVNFGLIYGGGAKGLAETTGQPVKLIKQLIKAFYDRYPGVSDWQRQYYTDMVALMKTSHLEHGEQVYCSLVQDGTSGRKFFFTEGSSPPWVRVKTGRKFSFKPTETKNYPVQGFAGGDIVMTAMWELYYRIALMDRTQIRMTVHDSILVDTDMDKSALRVLMVEVCNEIESLFSLPFKLDFDIASGLYWQ